MIEGPSLWDPTVFVDLPHRIETKLLLETNPTEGDLHRLNRLLLEDALLTELAHSPLRVFLSYQRADEAYVARICYGLRKQGSLDVYFHPDDRRLMAWQTAVGEALDASARLVLIVGCEVGDTQLTEALRFKELAGSAIDKKSLVLLLPECGQHLPTQLLQFQSCKRVSCTGRDAASATAAAMQITRALTGQWIPTDGLPIGYPFEYEKVIIDTYVSRSAEHEQRILEHGCPESWPDVQHLQSAPEYRTENPVSESAIGSDRDSDSHILVDVRSRKPTSLQPCEPPVCSCRARGQLTFSEAGPRRTHYFPLRRRRLLKIGVLVSGGIAPGINAVISGIVQRHALYNGPQTHEVRPAIERREYHLQVLGFRNGFAGLLAGDDVKVLFDSNAPRERLLARARRMANRGGSDIGTSRYDDLLSTAEPDTRDRNLDKVVENLTTNGHYDILYVIGGDGSMRAAHAIWRRARDMQKDLSVVGVPKTMDNDILWVWQSFGFLSAVERAREALQQLHTEATSNPRLCIVQLFGSDSGFVVSHAALASGVCDAALIPEVPFSMARLSEYIARKLSERFRPGRDGQSPYGMIVMAETAIPQDIQDYLTDPSIGLDSEEDRAIRNFIANGRRVHGQTPDQLRAGGLKVVARALQNRIREMQVDDMYWRDFRVFTNEPRHLLRAIPPSASDVAFGQRLGVLAVDNAMAGYTDFMISHWMTEYVLVPLELVVLGRKRVFDNGIFWKSVLASTGQPPIFV